MLTFFSLFINLACAQVTVPEITLAVLSFLLKPFFLKQTGFLCLFREEVITFLHAKSFPNSINTLFMGSLFTTPSVIGSDIRFNSILTLCRFVANSSNGYLPTGDRL